MNVIKRKIFNIIRDDDINNLASNIFDGFIISLIILNVIVIILDTFKMPEGFVSFSNIVEVVSVIIFTIEYLLRLWVSDLYHPGKPPASIRIRYVFSFMAIIDLLAILPFYIPFLIPIDLRVLRILRIFRLFRLVKVNRYTNALKVIGDVFKSKASQLISSMLVIAILMIISSVIMYDAENAAQPDVFDNALSGMWWSIVTLTTVGYGDIFPITVIGKVFSALISILGIGLIAVPTGIISAGFIEKTSKTKESDLTEEKKYCPYCGKHLD